MPTVYKHHGLRNEGVGTPFPFAYVALIVRCFVHGVRFSQAHAHFSGSNRFYVQQNWEYVTNLAFGVTTNHNPSKVSASCRCDLLPESTRVPLHVHWRAPFSALSERYCLFHRLPDKYFSHTSSICITHLSKIFLPTKTMCFDVSCVRRESCTVAEGRWKGVGARQHRS